MTTPYLEITEHHRLAMELLDTAKWYSRKGEWMEADLELGFALKHETAAAMTFKNHLESCFEPTRSVLFRSAGSIALQCGDKVKAKELFTIGLESNNIPPEIAKKIRELLKDCE